LGKNHCLITISRRKQDGKEDELTDVQTGSIPENADQGHDSKVISPTQRAKDSKWPDTYENVVVIAIQGDFILCKLKYHVV
jgi:hypothetical protein